MVIDLTKPPREMKPTQPISDLLSLLGMSQPEAAEFLTAHDVKTSEGAIKAWSRGIYAPPHDAVSVLWGLWVVVENGGTLPKHTPPSVAKRQASIAAIRAMVTAP